MNVKDEASIRATGGNAISCRGTNLEVGSGRLGWNQVELRTNQKCPAISNDEEIRIDWGGGFVTG